MTPEKAEQQYRNRKRTEMYLKTSKLRYNAVMEDVICSEDRNLSKEMLLKLMDCTFESSRRRQDRMRKIVPGVRHRKAGLLHGTPSGILLHEQVHRAHSTR